jgi:hypothetical protein
MAKWKQLQGIANNIASQFATSCEHYDWMMSENNVHEVRIDLLAETVEPTLFDISRNIQLIHLCAQNLKPLLDSQYGEPVDEVLLQMTRSADGLADIELTIRTEDGRVIVGHP